MRRPIPAVILLALALSASVAVGQMPLRRRLSPVVSDAPAGAAPAAPATPLSTGRLTLPGSTPRIDPAPQCRARCVVVRTACEATGGEDCASAWAACAPRCDRAG